MPIIRNHCLPKLISKFHLLNLYNRISMIQTLHNRFWWIENAHVMHEKSFHTQKAAVCSRELWAGEQVASHFLGNGRRGPLIGNDEIYCNMELGFLRINLGWTELKVRDSCFQQHIVTYCTPRNIINLFSFKFIERVISWLSDINWPTISDVSYL